MEIYIKIPTAIYFICLIIGLILFITILPPIILKLGDFFDNFINNLFKSTSISTATTSPPFKRVKK